MDRHNHLRRFSLISFCRHGPARRYIHQMKALSLLVLLIYNSCWETLGLKSSKKSLKSADQLMTRLNLISIVRKRFQRCEQPLSTIFREFGPRYLLFFVLFVNFRQSEMIMPNNGPEFLSNVANIDFVFVVFADPSDCIS